MSMTILDGNCYDSHYYNGAEGYGRRNLSSGNRLIPGAAIAICDVGDAISGGCFQCGDAEDGAKNNFFDNFKHNATFLWQRFSGFKVGLKIFLTFFANIQFN